MAQRNDPPVVTFEHLRRVTRRLREQEEALWQLVYEARTQQEHLTWEEIGEALGVTRQAAWEKFTLYRRRQGQSTVHPDQGTLL